MIIVKEAIVVEGKYDKIKLSSFIDAFIIETHGFQIFSDKEKMNLLRKLAKKTGLIVLTDADAAGFMIRNHIKSALGVENIIHVYTPDIYGKEKRKYIPSKEGKIGVEGIEKQAIIEAFKNAGVIIDGQKMENERNLGEKITALTFFEAGLTGKKDSKKLRKKLLKSLDLPEHMSTSSLIQTLNILMNAEDLSTHLKDIR